MLKVAVITGAGAVSDARPLTNSRATAAPSACFRGTPATRTGRRRANQ